MLANKTKPNSVCIKHQSIRARIKTIPSDADIDELLNGGDNGPAVALAVMGEHLDLPPDKCGCITLAITPNVSTPSVPLGADANTLAVEHQWRRWLVSSGRPDGDHQTQDGPHALAPSVAHVAASGHNATDHVIVDANFQLMNKWGMVTANSKFHEH
jgi:hypothetical protein